LFFPRLRFLQHNRANFKIYQTKLQ